MGILKKHVQKPMFCPILFDNLSHKFQIQNLKLLDLLMDELFTFSDIPTPSLCGRGGRAWHIVFT